MIIFIKHIDIEGPDTLDGLFRQKGFQTKTIELQNGDCLPDSFQDIDAIVSLGGPMNVYEEDKYPFLKDENKFLKKVIIQGIPFMGICLGSQLLAKAQEFKVGKSPVKEIGFYPIETTPDGQSDPLLSGLKEHLDVFQWHEDMSQLADQAVLLASSKGCPVQAFRIGRCAYGIQFHFEVEESTVGKWAEAYFPDTDPLKKSQKQSLLSDYQNKKESFQEISKTITNNFINIIQTYKEASPNA